MPRTPLRVNRAVHITSSYLQYLSRLLINIAACNNMRLLIINICILLDAFIRIFSLNDLSTDADIN